MGLTMLMNGLHSTYFDFGNGVATFSDLLDGFKFELIGETLPVESYLADEQSCQRRRRRDSAAV